MNFFLTETKEIRRSKNGKWISKTKNRDEFEFLINTKSQLFVVNKRIRRGVRKILNTRAKKEIPKKNFDVSEV